MCFPRVRQTLNEATGTASSKAPPYPRCDLKVLTAQANLA